MESVIDDDHEKNIKWYGKWNWGAFWFTWIWGLANGCYISLLVLLPVMNVVMPFYLGYKGNDLAWENGYWTNEEGFYRTQRKWAIAGWIFFCIIVFIMGIRIYDAHQNDLERQRISEEVVRTLRADKEACEILGSNFEVYKNLSVTTIKIGSKEVAYCNMIVKKRNDIYWIDVDLNDGQVEKIEISKTEQQSKKEILHVIKK